MAIFLLSREERLRFAAWCRHEADSNAGLAKQAEKLNAIPGLMAMLRGKEAAMRVVAKELESVEEQTIGGKD